MYLEKLKKLDMDLMQCILHKAPLIIKRTG